MKYDFYRNTICAIYFDFSAFDVSAAIIENESRELCDLNSTRESHFFRDFAHNFNMRDLGEALVVSRRQEE